jgi:hypothetical protein
LNYIGHKITEIHPFDPFETPKLGNPAFSNPSPYANPRDSGAEPARKKQCVSLPSVFAQSLRIDLHLFLISDPLAVYAV